MSGAHNAVPVAVVVTGEPETLARHGGGARSWKDLYCSPLVQVSLIGCVCFCCPGMFNAVTGMGGGGQVDDKAANNALTALYTTFAVFGIAGGGIYNVVGPRITLLFGCSFYVLYVGSFLYYNHYTQQGFVIVAGALLGMGAGLLWAGQGAMMTSYPTEARKGVYISLFWAIFNLGGVVGGFVPFILNYHNPYGRVTDATYIAFMVIMGFGALLTLTLVSPEKVVREDGSRVSGARQNPSTWTEVREILKLFADWRMLLFFLPSWSSNFFYAYQFNKVNLALFTVRTRGLNNASYWGAQMVGSAALGLLLDRGPGGRRWRGYFGVATVAAFSAAVWGGGFANQLHHQTGAKLDFKDSGTSYAGPFALYFCYGLLDAMFQTLCYWVIGALTDDAPTLSRYSGFYKGVQSAGAAVAWQVDSNKNISASGELIINWALMSASFPLLLILVALAVHDTAPPFHKPDDLSKSRVTIKPQSEASALV